jgi:ABC-2 type transport system ATP-binding protein
MDTVVRAFDLTKRYGSVTAVDRLSLEIGAGEIYGFLGLNGAGKTTTIRMMLGLVRPSHGTVELLGSDTRSGWRNAWASVGYLVETPAAYPELTVRENLELARRLRNATDTGPVADVIDRLRLTEYASQKARTLSLGNAQRLGIAKALLHAPRLLLLDEPANGLDPAGIVEVRELLLRLATEEGTTVFLSSHILGEVSKLATRIGIIHRGRLLVERRADELDKDRRALLLVNARDRNAAERLLRKAGFEPRTTDRGDLGISASAALERPEEVGRLLTKAGHPPTLLKVEREDLESYFLRLVGEAGGGDQ